jgi:hypothetical protein
LGQEGEEPGAQKHAQNASTPQPEGCPPVQVAPHQMPPRAGDSGKDDGEESGAHRQRGRETHPKVDDGEHHAAAAGADEAAQEAGEEAHHQQDEPPSDADGRLAFRVIPDQRSPDDHAGYDGQQHQGENLRPIPWNLWGSHICPPFLDA